MDNAKEIQIRSTIAFLEQQIEQLGHYLPETYGFLVSELDQQMRELVELQVTQMKGSGVMGRRIKGV